MSIWGTHEVPEGQALQFSVQGMEIEIRRRGREWLFAHRISPAADAPQAQGDGSTEAPCRTSVQTPSQAPGENPGASPAESATEPVAEPAFRRYVASDDSQTLKLSPVMPDRPVVARAEMAFALGPGVEARFYAEIPVWVRATVSGDDRRVLFDAPVRKLSNTWFGGVATGRLCYSLDCPLVFRREELSGCEGIAVCTLRYRNQSRVPFSSGKVAIFADLLRVYQGPGGLWTNEAVATIMGPEQLNLSVAEALPFPKQQLQKLSDSRVHASENILRKGLILLRTITNY